MFHKLNNMRDEELLQKFATSHKTVYITELWDRYSALIYGLCLNYFKNKQDSQDALSSIFEIIIKKAVTHKIHAVKAWIYTLSKNYCLAVLRKRNRRKIIFSDYIENRDSSYSEIKFEEEHRGVKNALENLSENQKICVQLFYYKNYSYKEISEHTGVSIKTVKSNLQNGRRNLKNQLKLLK